MSLEENIKEIQTIVDMYNGYYGDVLYSSYVGDSVSKSNLELIKEGQEERVTIAYLQEKIIEAQGG
mgnify:CR=1 FL=1|tara:strand:- start:2409 stop:2606 length:198 start_codon:yes stop_codon:yes gene_type:complete